jgi:uncharacterized iron-regulated protein
MILCDAIRLRTHFILLSATTALACQIPACGHRAAQTAAVPANSPPSEALQRGPIRYFDTRSATELAGVGVQQRLASAEYLLLGELHDNPAHHRAQAQLLQTSLHAAPKSSVFFEMLEPAQEAFAQGYLARSEPASGFGAAVQWAKGWPPFSEYLPIVDVIVAQKLAVYAANLAKTDVRAIAMGTRDVVLPPMSSALEAELATEIDEGHCGMLPKEQLAPMAKAQRARDLAMAESMIRIDGPRVLIAGRGHTRNDRGVGFVLRAMGKRNVLTIGLFEGSRDTSLAALASQYDIIGVTAGPDSARKDPCEAFRKQQSARE